MSICHCSFMWKIRKIPCWFFIKLETPHFRLVLGLCAPKSLEQRFLKKPNPTNFYLREHSNFFSRVWSLQFHWTLKAFWVVCFFGFFCRTWFSVCWPWSFEKQIAATEREERCWAICFLLRGSYQTWDYPLIIVFEWCKMAGTLEWNKMSNVTIKWYF